MNFTPPSWRPDAVISPHGWVCPITKEVLVANRFLQPAFEQHLQSLNTETTPEEIISIDSNLEEIPKTIVPIDSNLEKIPKTIAPDDKKSRSKSKN